MPVPSVDAAHLSFAQLKERGEKVRMELQKTLRVHETLITRSQRLRASIDGQRETNTKTTPVPDEHDLLTPRERQVLKCIAEGHATKEVAALLGISFKTAACHRYNIMDKLGVHETASLVRHAIRTGLVQL